MKTLKSKLLMLTILVIGVAAMSFAFTSQEKSEMKSETKELVKWRYIGDSTDEGEFCDPSNWEKGKGQNCQTEGDLPCQLSAPAEDDIELGTYLHDLTNNDVMAIVDSKKD